MYFSLLHNTYKRHAAADNAHATVFSCGIPDIGAAPRLSEFKELTSKYNVGNRVLHLH